MLCFFLCAALLFFSCDKNAPDAFRRQNPSAVVEIGRADEEIVKIAEDARRTLPIFFRKLARPEKGADNFCVKYPLSAYNGGTEYVWLASIRFKDGLYYGNIANSTRLVDSVSKGDAIIFDTDKIADWMYVQNGKIMGGRSIKYLLEKTPEDRRSESQRKILGMFD
jgi:uncharacterized protein YegJ (DUF2314 family)